MKATVEPYLKQRCISGYTDSYDAVGKLHVLRYQADMPKGVIVICHGFTESYPKYDELVYYFLQAGYHVWLPEHCGHGWSYRLTKDSSLVHIDTWKRYIRDFLKICQMAKKEYPNLPLNLFAHSMGGNRSHCSVLEAGVVSTCDFKFSDDPTTYCKCSVGNFCVGVNAPVPDRKSRTLCAWTEAI